MTTPTVVGIDPSLTSTGVVTGTGAHTITSEPDGNSLTDRRIRLVRILDEVDRIVCPVDDPWTPVDCADLAVIESPAFSRTTGHHHDRSGLWWLIIERLTDKTIPVAEATPSALKKFATGKGTATKADMRMALYQRAGLDWRDDNQVDAWWLRQLGLHLTGSDERIDLPKTHLAALSKINKPTLTGG